MRKKLTADDVLSTIHIYPTLAEANKKAAGEWKKAHLPPVALTIGEKLNRFLRGD